MDGEIFFWVLAALDALGGILALLESTNVDSTEPNALAPADAALPDLLRRQKLDARGRILSLEREDAARRALNRQRAWDELAAAVRKDLGEVAALLANLPAQPPEGFAAEADEWWAELLLEGHHPVRARYLREGGAGWRRAPVAGDERLADPLRRDGDRPWWAVCSEEGDRNVASLGVALHYAEQALTAADPEESDIPF